MPLGVEDNRSEIKNQKLNIKIVEVLPPAEEPCKYAPGVNSKELRM